MVLASSVGLSGRTGETEGGDGDEDDCSEFVEFADFFTLTAVKPILILTYLVIRGKLRKKLKFLNWDGTW